MFVKRDQCAREPGGVARHDPCALNIQVLSVVSRGSVRHTRHSVFFAALEDPLYSGSLVLFFVGCSDFPRGAIDDDVGDVEQISESNVSGEASSCKLSKPVSIIVEAKDWLALANG